MKTKYRKPLVVFTPKSLLRDPRVVSTVEEFATGSFQETIDDTSVNKKDVKTLVFCTGKFYYDLHTERENLARKDVALIRIEQLFPLPVEQLKAIIASYPNADDYVWAQEEPKNAGAWSFVAPLIETALGKRPQYAGRAAAAATATGLMKRHNAEQAKLIAEALGASRAEVNAAIRGGLKSSNKAA
jgi:2-oxoglutarate dehydrogenase E1 component